ncbi:MAG: NAD(P)-dependent alcohol dehydrogenase [marine benthic group bacterium]|nr:NAD(P)-dependent alcohol dehydrogenase [Gemmatimonadota bacterium]
MRAITYRRYGSADVLELVEAAKPEPGPQEVVVRTHAASVNPLDWHFMRGSPAPVRLMTGVFRPRNGRLGVDLAGVVEAVGSKVTGFQEGETVFGAARGAFAEYASARADRLVRKPRDISFEQAAAVPIAALTALQGLRDKGRLQPEQKVLVIGAAGGVGTFAVQIARSFGAAVTGVCSTRNVEMVTSIGAERVVDYTRDDFAKGETRYHVVLDCIGDRSLSDYRRVMDPGGVYVGVGGSGGTMKMLLDLLKVRVVSPFVSQRFVSFIASLNATDLDAIAELLMSGKVTPVIDRTYPLERTADAIRYLETKHARGKVVITIR